MNVVSLPPADLSDQDILDCYDDRFEDTRRRLRDLCAAQGLRWSEFPIAGGDSLCRVDIGPGEATGRLIVLSGVHGIEGFCGSAVQIALLRRFAARPPGTRVILLHMVNPAGARAGRRTNRDNVDLNRNLLFDHAALARVDGRARTIGRLFSSPVLSRLPDPVWVPLALARAMVSGGLATVRKTLAGGQFFDPGAPFFGGRALAPELATLLTAVGDAVGAGTASRTILFDLHSGVGRYGAASLLGHGESALSPRTIFGVPVADGHGPKGVGFPARGEVIGGLKARLDATEACGVTFEFGTGPALGTLLAIRASNSAHAHFPASRRREQAARARMTRAFCPDDPAWRIGYVRRALHFLDRAIHCLANGEA